MMSVIIIEDISISIADRIENIASINGQIVRIESAGDNLVNVCLSQNEKCGLSFRRDDVLIYNIEQTNHFVSFSVSDFSSIKIL